MRILLTAAAIIVTSLCFLVNCSTTTYNVISTIGKDHHSMGVIVDGKMYPLQASKDIPVLHTGPAPSASGSYHYAKLDRDHGIVEKEPFQRHLDKNLETTLNEFYNRTWNTQPPLAELPTLVEPLPGIHRIDSGLHAKNQIPTIYLSGDQADIDWMHSNTSLNTKVTLDMHFIETDKMTTVKGIELKLAGHSSKWMDKLSYNVKTPKDHPLYGYQRMKLRALRTDPSYIREILCYEMMHAMGLPVSGASYVRLIMNDQPLGLFLMIEPYKGNWYKNEFAVDGHGATYQGFVGSNLAYLGNNATAYKKTYKIESSASKKHGGKEASNYKQVIDFTRFLAEAPTSSPDAANIWSEHIDMESVIRSLVIEIVAGFSDGYLANTNNFFLYDNLVENRLMYLAADFDTTVGNTIVTLADQWSGNYTQYPGFTMRPLAQKLIQVTEFKARFEHLLSKAANELINDAAIQPRIDDLVNMIRQDVDWDLALLPKVNQHPKFENFTGNLADIDDNIRRLAPPINLDAVVELLSRKNMDLDTAVYKPSDHISLPSVTQWFSTQSKALQNYFIQHPPPASLLSYKL